MYALNLLISSVGPDPQTTDDGQTDKHADTDIRIYHHFDGMFSKCNSKWSQSSPVRVQSEPLFLSLARSFCLLNSFYCIRFPRRRLELLLVQFVFLLFPLLTKTEIFCCLCYIFTYSKTAEFESSFCKQTGQMSHVLRCPSSSNLSVNVDYEFQERI